MKRNDKRQRRRNIRLKRRNSNKCTECGRHSSLEHSSYCYECYLKRTAQRHLGSTSEWAELENLLLRQHSRCAYTGWPIDLGKDASLEHVEPVSRSPVRARDVTNLRWVKKEVNFAKRNMTLKEFLDMCRAVLKNFGWVVTRSRKL